MNVTKIKDYAMLLSIGILLLLCFILYQAYELKAERVLRLETERQILLENEKLLSESMNKQNKLIKELEVKETLIDNSKLLEIYVKDESCEAELEAYKKLFKELGAR